ncbi:MAG: hypothetical protein CMM07_20320 [Rhodopirellula sp.]|nr:hypothetical protein [Rhodopirellula sp.]
MQLDQTHVVIRLRKFTEIGDLSLIMIRRYPEALLVGFGAGAIGWVITNMILLGWIPWEESSYGLDDEAAFGEVSRYLIWMTLLVTLQTPAAGVFTTLYLGQAVFEKRPTWKFVRSEVRRQFKRWFWVLGIQRLAVPTMILLAFRWGQPVSGFWDICIPLIILGWAVVVRANRPFAPEILLLEQCPLRASSESVITMSKRSKSLHRPMSGELTGRFASVSLILAGIAFSCFYTLISFRGITLGFWNFMNLTVLLVFFPLALWLVASVSVIIRLLNYLDTRIRLEGWEVELSVRAEALRQFGSEEPANAAPEPHSQDSKPAETKDSVKPKAQRIPTAGAK